MCSYFFFFNDTATTEIYTLSLHDALPISATVFVAHDMKHDRQVALKVLHPELAAAVGPERFLREIQLAARDRKSHTSELQSRLHLVCRLLLEKKKKQPVYVRACRDPACAP